MLLPDLREQVLQANLELVRQGLVLFTFGNVSGIAREKGLVVIKPSGVPYDSMKPAHLVVTDLAGKIVEGELRPSSDLPTHLALYRRSPRSAELLIRTRSMPRPGHRLAAPSHVSARRTPTISTGRCRSRTACPIQKSPQDYELNTGHAIVRAFQKIDYAAIPAVLVANHGPFCWGRDAGEAAHNAAILEAVARMAFFTIRINDQAEPVGRTLHDKHYLRKHGTNAYYGQKKEPK